MDKRLNGRTGLYESGGTPLRSIFKAFHLKLGEMHLNIFDFYWFSVHLNGVRIASQQRPADKNRRGRVLPFATWTSWTAGLSYVVLNCANFVRISPGCCSLSA